MLAVALTLAAIQQGPNPADFPWQPQGSIETREFQVERRSEDGNTVLGTEFVKLEYKVSLKKVEYEPMPDLDGFQCSNECQGKKHKDHSQCDLSCDTKCTKLHEKFQAGEYIEDEAGKARATADSGKLARGLGFPGGPDNWSSANSNALAQLRRDAAKKVKVSMKHTKDPCTSMLGFTGVKRTDIYVKGEFRKVGYYMSRGVKTPIDEPAGSHEARVGTMYVPVPEPIGYTSNVACRCKAVEEPPKDSGTVPKDKPTIGRTPTYSGLGWRKPDGTVVIPDEQMIRIRAYGDGITYIILEIQNLTNERFFAEAEPGTYAYPDSPMIQIMVIMVRQRFEVVPLGTTTLMMPLDNGEPVQKLERLRVACTEIDKKPPSESTTFTFRQNQDDVVYRLGMKTNSSMIRGPWDQARLWIYTDAAPLDVINERLVPGISQGRYVDLLYDVEKTGKVDMSAARYRKCFDQGLLAAENASPEATAWLAQKLSEMDKRKTLEYIRKSGPEWASGLSDATQTDRLRHYGAIAKGLIASPDEEIRAAGLGMLLAVPEPSRQQVGKAADVGSLFYLVSSKSPAELGLVVDVLVSYKPRMAKEMVSFIAEYGPTEARKKAADALAAMG